MRLLLVFPFFPFPPNDGGRIGFFNAIKYLSRRHEVVVVSNATELDLTSVSELKPYCLDVRVLVRSRALDSWRVALGLFRDPPASASKYWHPELGKLIRQTIDDYGIELAEFHHLNTAAYRPFSGSLPSILREHNVEYVVWQRYAEHAETWNERSYARWCAPRVRRFEAASAVRFDRCVVVTPADAGHLLDAAPRARIEVIPSGVDTEYFYPAREREEEPCSMALTGSFDWKPKQHNLRVVLEEIFPRIKAKLPEAKLYVVGKGVPEELRRLGAETPGVTVTGPVADVRPYVQRASLVINYLESGGGIALKVLEAMAMRKPVLSNPLGTEGVDAEHGCQVFHAQDVQEFAAAAVMLLQSPDLRGALARQGYERVIKKYAWSHLATQFEQCYLTILEERRRVSQVPVSAAI